MSYGIAWYLKYKKYFQNENTTKQSFFKKKIPLKDKGISFDKIFRM